MTTEKQQHEPVELLTLRGTVIVLNQAEASLRFQQTNHPQLKRLADRIERVKIELQEFAL